MKVAYFTVSAIWAFLMCFELSTILLGTMYGDDSMASAAFGGFEMLSVVGMAWIPVAACAAWNLHCLDKTVPFRKNLSALTALGHCIYYIALIGVPLFMLQICPQVLEKFDYRYYLWPAAIYLLALGLANSLQVYTFYSMQSTIE